MSHWWHASSYRFALFFVGKSELGLVDDYSLELVRGNNYHGPKLESKLKLISANIRNLSDLYKIIPLIPWIFFLRNDSSTPYGMNVWKMLPVRLLFNFIPNMDE